MQHPKKTRRGRQQISHCTACLGDERALTPQYRGCADVLAQLVEGERGDDRSRLAARSGHSVRRGTELRREHLRGVAVRRRVRSEVEEELEEREAHDERHRVQRVELAREDPDYDAV